MDDLNGCLERTAGDSRIRVCLLSSLGYGLYHPESGHPFGGAEVQMYLLALALAQDPTYRICVITTVQGQSRVEQHGDLTLVAREARHRLDPQGPGAPHGLVGRIRAYAAAYRDMSRLLRGVDADLYVHAGAGVEVGAYGLICRRLRRPFVYVVASSADLLTPARIVTGPLRWLFPMGIRLARAIVCRTEEQRRWLRERFGREGIVIRTGHPGVPVRADPDENQENLAFTGHPTDIVWVGRLHPLKQPGLFLDLAARFPEQRFAMVALRDPTHPEQLEMVRERVNALNNVTLALDVPLPEVDRFFARAKILVNTSTYEGFPNTFVQAALHGAPILSWTVDPDRVLTTQQIGLCAGGSFERLVEAVGDLCADESARRALADRAREYARRHHDLNRTVAEFKSLIRSLHEGHRTTPDGCAVSQDLWRG